LVGWLSLGGAIYNNNNGASLTRFRADKPSRQLARLGLILHKPQVDGILRVQKTVWNPSRPLDCFASGVGLDFKLCIFFAKCFELKCLQSCLVST
jgi:hypothetical protein